MNKQKTLERQIRSLREKIVAIEQKRSRSQANIISAMAAKTAPSEEDVKFFNQYNAEIDSLREEIRAKQAELSASDHG